MPTALILFGIGSLLWHYLDPWMVIMALNIAAWVITREDPEDP